VLLAAGVMLLAGTAAHFVAAEQLARGEPVRLAAVESRRQSQAVAINAEGTIVGFAFDPAPRTAVVWPNGMPAAVLAPLPGESESQASAINELGVAVGWSRNTDGRHTAVVWGRDGVPIALAALPGDLDSRATGINEAGLIVGTSSANDVDRAVIWERRGSPTVLPQLPRHPDGEARGLNGVGRVVGWSESERDPESGYTTKTAMIWERDGSNQALPPLPGDAESLALATHPAGIVVGESARTIPGDPVIFRFSAVLWNRDGRAHPLAPLPGNDEVTMADGELFAGSAARAIARSGVIVGSSGRRGALWDADGHVSMLTPLPGDSRSWADGVNDDGVAVGRSGDESHRTAVVWR